MVIFMACLCLYSADEPRVDVKISKFYDPNRPDDPTTKSLIELMDADPGVVVSQWGSIQLPGGGSRAPILMAIAGKTAPDVMESWFHIISNDIKQGFLYPLNEWIGEDKNGNGQIDDAEAKWPGWKNIPLLWRQVATSGGKVYGIPQCSKNYMGIVFRIDMVREAGLDPDKTPETWDELIYWCQKLTKPNMEIPGAVFKRGQRGICLQPNGFLWLPWMQSAGGNPIIQLRKSPRDGNEFEFPMDATSFITPTGEDLFMSPPVWRANFASPAGIAAAGLYHRLRWMKWISDPETNEPVNLSEDDLKNGFATVNGRKIPFKASDIITGVARGQTGQRGTGAYDMLSRGEIAMLSGSVEGITGIGGVTGIDPNYLSWFPFPAKSKTEGRKVLQVQQHYAVMVEGVGRRDKPARDKVWEVMNAITSQNVKDDHVRNMVLEGLAKFVNPTDLTRLDFTDYLKDISPRVQNYYKEMQNGTIGLYTEPFMGFWLTMDDSMNRSILSLVIAETGENFDYAAALKKVEHEANSGLMFGRTEKELDQYRPTARIIFAVIVIFIVFISFMMIRSFVQMKDKAPSTKNIQSKSMPWLMMIPALVLIGLWSYYPLIRGMVMAFQDYHIVGDSKFTGLDNFISLALDSSFWVSLGRTCQFVFLNMLLAFTAPILLAILLSEIPKGKYFYRTIFFLPHVTSGLVITLMWKLMYEPTPEGFFNQMIAYLNCIPFVHIDSQTWLQDPKIAMVCCIIPTVWASMGVSNLIYLAALKGVPEEIYEAADLDGAGVWTKLTKITLPTLFPLIIINFVGAFIGTFQNMGNIFLLTFGGPGDATMVVGMKIWIEAYNNLRFSMATSIAWVVGALLIGFTYMQVQILKKVEFKKAEWS
ncbi:MAG: hypothetical protein A2X45_22275 [Lentisphaerae bacterium GWF2_50_93]|nr:MAG: hypothetical protein A2X45_22275 [Lentisphaerae bacterium GWF2_50_93]